jgi:SulP family sulfate permease
MVEIQERLLPTWIKTYRRENLNPDVIAGLLVCVLVLPQSLAYAMLAGLPPQLGLYASIVPVVVYALVGSSMTQMVGPVAITAIMTFAVLSPLAAPGSAEYLALASTLALMSGIFVSALGLLRLGFLANLLSRPVVSGFISGSALLILSSQVAQLLGLQTPGTGNRDLRAFFLEQLPHYNQTTALIGVAGLAGLLAARALPTSALERFGLSHHGAEMATRLAPLLVVVTATLTVVAFDLDGHHSVAVVGLVSGSVSGALPHFPDWSAVTALLAPALTLAFIGTVQNITMAQALAIKRHERVDANRELWGLGASNVAAAFFGGMPVGGGLSRSAVNVASGARTPLSGLVSALCMLGVVLAGTSWFSRIPLAILAASIMAAAISMIDLAEWRRAWAYDRADAFALLGTAAGVLLWGFQNGIVVGIGLSLVTLLYRSSLPHIAVVGRIVDTEHFRNVERHGVQTLSGVLFLRIDESIFFGNLRAIESRLMAEVAKTPGVHDVVLIMSAVNRVDLTGLEGLREIEQDLRTRAIALHLAEVKGPVQDLLSRTSLWQALSGRIHLSANDAFMQLQ